MITVGRALHKAVSVLEAAGLEAPRREARLIIRHAMGLGSGAWLDSEHLLDEAGFMCAVLRRADREPLAFITGRRGFWTLELEVSPATLIPRPESETLIEAVLEAVPERGAIRKVLDLGTGTGCLLLAALSEYPSAFGIGVDLSPAAAALAARNAAACGLATRSAFIAADWSEAIAGRFDLVLSNPPYIAAADLAGLMPEVREHEPRLALDGGADGLGAYRALLGVLPDLLAPGGLAVLELGAGQADPVCQLGHEAGFAHIGCVHDLAGIPRALRLRPQG